MTIRRAASVILASTCLVPALVHAGAQLTEIETKWLKAASPVLAYAQRTGLPVDIIVQPEARATDVPLAMGFSKGRCKLVLSMRGNPDAEKTLQDVPPAQHGLLIEVMAAHEIGHCWRYAQGTWHQLPSGFVESGDETASNPALLVASREMRETRREEGFADMAALAWTRQFHAADYAMVYRWLHTLRDDVAVPGSGHDTRAWVKVASDPSVFAASGAPFQDASDAWRKGLLTPAQPLAAALAVSNTQ